jgi:hypothetical protein
MFQVKKYERRRLLISHSIVRTTTFNKDIVCALMYSLAKQNKILLPQIFI